MYYIPDAFDDHFDEQINSTLFLLRVHYACQIPQSLKSAVIQQWLKGVERDKIGFEFGISGGAVTKIVNAWRQAIDFPVADELRELAVNLRKIGITPGECAIGCRVQGWWKKLGIGNDQFQSFLSDIYKRSVELG